jgi:hypothetical protein
MILALSLGTYIGQGVWHDSASTTHKYAIEMRIEKLPNGNIRQWFKHIFFEEGGQAIEQTLDTVPGKNGIFEMILVGTSIVGRGYCSSEACHYSLPVPSNLVEVTQFFAADGAIKRIIGSAEKNAQGNYIWWEEQISRK